MKIFHFNNLCKLKRNALWQLNILDLISFNSHGCHDCYRRALNHPMSMWRVHPSNSTKDSLGQSESFWPSPKLILVFSFDRCSRFTVLQMARLGKNSICCCFKKTESICCTWYIVLINALEFAFCTVSLPSFDIFHFIYFLFKLGSRALWEMISYC